MKTSLLLVLACGVLTANAIAQTIPKGDIVVDVEAFAALPTSDNGQTARANYLVAAPDGRLFANDQRGPMYTISADGATVTPYLDLAKTTKLLFDNGERGFQSFAFHPDFNVAGAAGYGKFYTMASQSDTTVTPTFTPQIAGADRDHDEVLLEWTAADAAAATFVAADAAHPFREVLRIQRPASNHNAGFIAFNPTAAAGTADRGNLYIGTGDSGNGGDPLGLAQSLGKAYGAILRINPLGGTPYSVPADNPHATNASFLPEKYLAGFRNPQRFSWDLATGRMFISDIGQGRWEEVDLAVAGANYGWNAREGDYEYHSDDSEGAFTRGDAAATGFTYPIAEYPHFGSIGNGVSIGPVVRGSGIPALAGRLLFSDFPTGTPYTIDADAVSSTGAIAAITELRLRSGGVEMSFEDMIHQLKPAATRADLRFGTDARQRVYLLNKQDGLIRRLVSNTPAVTPTPTPTPPPVVTPTPPPAGTPTISVTLDKTAISRRAGEAATVTITRNTGTDVALKVKFTLAGTAINGEDYEFRPLKKVIKAGRTSAVVRIVPLATGADGKVRLVIQPNAAYAVDLNARKAKVSIND